MHKHAPISLSISAPFILTDWVTWDIFQLYICTYSAFIDNFFLKPYSCSACCKQLVKHNVMQDIQDIVLFVCSLFFA